MKEVVSLNAMAKPLTGLISAGIVPVLIGQSIEIPMVQKLGHA
jgi:hypothetical protein